MNLFRFDLDDMNFQLTTAQDMNNFDQIGKALVQLLCEFKLRMGMPQIQQMLEELDLGCGRMGPVYNEFIRHEELLGTLKPITVSPEEVAFPRSCNNLMKFADSSSIYKKGTPIHVKGALIYNYHLHKHKLEMKYPVIRDSDKIKFLMLKIPNNIKDFVVSFKKIT